MKLTKRSDLVELRESAARRRTAPPRRLQSPPLHSVSRRTSRRCHTTPLPVPRSSFIFVYFFINFVFACHLVTIGPFAVGLKFETKKKDPIGRRIQKEINQLQKSQTDGIVISNNNFEEREREIERSKKEKEVVRYKK